MHRRALQRQNLACHKYTLKLPSTGHQKGHALKYYLLVAGSSMALRINTTAETMPTTYTLRSEPKALTGPIQTDLHT
jgi:hypothetical protein